MKLTVNELFAGIGSQSAALKRLGIDFEVVGIAEIDKYAIMSYEAIHGPVRNYGDISKIEKLDYADFWTYSFPCQDISVAGKGAGIEKGVTRSGLLYEVERLLEKSVECGEAPKYLMLENVKNLVGKKFKPQFDEWIARLDQLGYNTYWQVLNAKHYGIPQNRERVFGISIRKDIDTGYVFPEPFDNGMRLKDVLESEVDEKFYISDKMVNGFLKHNINHREKVTGFIWEPTDTEKYAKTLRANAALCPTDNTIRIGNIYGEDKGTGFAGNVWDKDGLCPTLTTMQGGNRQPMMLIPQATQKGYIECNIPGVADLSFPDSKTRRGRVQDGGEICPTLMAGSQDLCYIDNVVEPNVKSSQEKTVELIEDVRNGKFDPGIVYGKTLFQSSRMTDRPTEEVSHLIKSQKVDAGIIYNFRIRKLTPLECYCLMGFSDSDFHKAEAVVSNSQLYKQAGNSIVVDVLYYLFKNLFLDRPTEKRIVTEEGQLPGQMVITDYIKGETN